MTVSDIKAPTPSIADLIRPWLNFRTEKLFLGSHAMLLTLSVICVFPIYWMIVTALRADGDIYSTSLLPENPSLENFRYALEAAPILKTIANTFIVSAVATIGQALTGLMAAYVFARWHLSLGKAMLGLLTITWLIPPQVIMIPNFVLVNDLGLLDTLTGIFLPHIASAFAVMMLYQAMRSFPKELIESAEMDGCGHVRILFGVIAPNIKPVIASVSIILFISFWNEYLWPLLVTRSMDNAVVQIGLQMFLTQEGSQWGALMAAATLGSVPILLLYAIMQRQIIDTFVRSGIR
ncbi:MAG: carbohydrate ABC transporter permease [Alphaproteobacteria bacterium]|nr:carbohydrate ABC transporter permease [Alphaproteobacteria bacterium]